jgi:hypothetical protein
MVNFSRFSINVNLVFTKSKTKIKIAIFFNIGIFSVNDNMMEIPFVGLIGCTVRAGFSWISRWENWKMRASDHQ